MGLFPFNKRHSASIAALAWLSMAACWFGLSASSPGVLGFVVVAILVLGVPHGGLDHWTGRLLLEPALGRLWGIAFFAGYLGIGILVVLGWILIPAVTLLGFFLVSAWHFGLEDERSVLDDRVGDQIAAVAIGGLVVWIPFLTQPQQIFGLLETITSGSMLSVPAVMDGTRAIACVLVPIAGLVVIRDLRQGQLARSWRNVTFAGLFATVDPIISFSIYFCGWHSLRGLRRLASVHGQTYTETAVGAAPMTIGASLISCVGWWFLNGSQNVQEATIRTLFIALSAIAVPHLLLHGPVTGLFAGGKRNGVGMQVNKAVT